MSEHERPTAVSDEEQPAAPAHEVSAETPVAGTTGAPASQAGAQAPPPADETGAIEVFLPADVTAADPVDSVDSSDAAAVGERPAWLRRRNVAVIGIAAAVLVLTAVAGPIAWDAWRHDNVEITTPPRIAGLVLDDSQGAHETIDYLRLAVETGVSLNKSTGAVYADEAGHSRSVLFVGGTGPVGSPDAALTKTFLLISDNNGDVEGVRSLPPGPLGGVMKCGSTKTDTGAMAVCGWADQSSLGIAMFPNRSVDQSAELLRGMRKVMQQSR
ncbi:hypothetical protein HC028_18670 [Planosporangium flavigriseum]|uniref:Uncharacterized protein n=1 Tax=Planosporangium flavigriseum TaxID=373681 RepID=A0A8J3LR29_9ACTN|nr:hypothetical protein [Planosporangium flavigriseum]NJC66513.1 hypothetical protein [Planosporangium flavigriseum]GIG76462.1 hypothetical protein Pfl04_48660 [Planosporangium flavigriseum]